MLLPDVQNQYHLEEINSARHELALYITENVKIAIFVYIYIYIRLNPMQSGTGSEIRDTIMKFFSVSI